MPRHSAPVPRRACLAVIRTFPETKASSALLRTGIAVVLSSERRNGHRFSRRLAASQHDSVVLLTTEEIGAAETTQAIYRTPKG